MRRCVVRVFATSGPRIKIRLFAGYDYEDDDSLEDRYAKAPMVLNCMVQMDARPFLSPARFATLVLQHYNGCKSSRVGLRTARPTSRFTMSRVQTVARWIRRLTVARITALALI